MIQGFPFKGSIDTVFIYKQLFKNNKLLAIGGLPANKIGGVSYAAERSGSNPGNHISHRF